MPKMVEVVIDSVRVSLTNQQRIVVLREVNTERYLPIWIGPFEAEAITIALQEIEVARPQTHDLLKNILQHLNARLLRVEIINLKEDVFYGNLVLDVADTIINIDSRPSDALALAVRAHVPVLVAREVLESAGIEPEKDINTPLQGQPNDTTPSSIDKEPGTEETEGRLSVFEDFLQNLDIDGLSDQSDEEDNPDDDLEK